MKVPRKLRGVRIMTTDREAQLRQFLAEVRAASLKHGFSVTPTHGEFIEIMDEREERPKDWPIAAFATRLGRRIEGLDVQSIIPREMAE